LEGFAETVATPIKPIRILNVVARPVAPKLDATKAKPKSPQNITGGQRRYNQGSENGFVCECNERGGFLRLCPVRP
jgi:hypothetical protein